MRSRPIVLLIVVAALSIQNPLLAHHSSAAFDAGKKVILKGTVKEWVYSNPHCMLLLDVKADQNKQLTIAEALTKITSANPSLESRLAVGVARIGARDERVKASRIGLLINEDFGGPPQSIVVVGKLHFMEADALRIICGAQDSDLRENY